MEIINKKVADLIPYINNARTHDDKQITQIAASIKEFGFNNPILLDGSNGIVAGHGRLLAAKKLGLTEVPCIELAHLSPTQKKAYILADNKLALNSGWDLDLLAAEIGELKEADIDIDLIGFSEEELDDLPLDVESPIDSEKADEIPEEVEPKCKLGQIWRLGKHRLMCGDSTNKGCILKLTNNQKVDMVFTDPPYGISVVGDNEEVGPNFGVAQKGKYKKVIGDETTDTAKKAYKLINEISKKIILWGGNYFLDFLPFSDGFIIWDKRVDSGIKNSFADGEIAWCSFHTPLRIYHQLWNGMIREGEKEKRIHPTQKPIKILSEIINDFSREKENILDLFGGSGSTLLACETTGRRCFMMEIDPHYCDVIIQRWEDLTDKKAELIEG